MTDNATMDRNLALEAVRVTEAAALAASRLMGRGDEKAADQAAVDAMRKALNGLTIDGTVVIGEGERDEAPMLYIGEKVGAGHGPEDRHRARSARRHDDHRQGRRQRARGHRHGRGRRLPQRARRLHGQDRGRRRPAGRASSISTRRRRTNLKNLAKAKKADVADLVVCILDRPRHAELIAKVREAGARIMLIADGDVSGVIATSRPDSGIDIYMGSGGAPEGVLAAAALRCIGGQMQGRLLFRNDDERGRAAALRHHRPQPQIRSARSRQGRRHVRRDRRHQRHHAAGRAPLRRRRHHAFDGHALEDRHGAHDRGARTISTASRSALG